MCRHRKEKKCIKWGNHPLFNRPAFSGRAGLISTLVTERQEMLLHCRKRSSTSKKANGCRRKIRGRKACEREEQWGLFLRARERPQTALLPPCGKSMRSCLWLRAGPGLPNPCPTAISGEPAPQAQWVQECSVFSPDWEA